MLDKFWESLGEGVAKNWLDYLFGPAFLFWVGGAGIYIWKTGLDPVIKMIQGWGIPAQVVLLIAGILLIVFSTLAAQAVSLPLLRLLEGYWPWPLNYLARWIVALRKKPFTQRYSRLRLLKAKTDPLTPAEQAQLTDLEMWAHRFPPSAKDLLATGLGNLLRARELTPKNRYGLDAVVCWPRLWCLLPESERQDLQAARAALNSQVALWLWGALFLVWTWISWWAVPIALVWMILAYAVAYQTAGSYGDLVESAFDLHRFELYDAFGWRRPKDSQEEKAKGAELSEFLWRGTTPGTVFYHFDDTKKGD